MQRSSTYKNDGARSIPQMWCTTVLQKVSVAAWRDATGLCVPSPATTQSQHALGFPLLSLAEEHPRTQPNVIKSFKTNFSTLKEILH